MAEKTLEEMYAEMEAANNAAQLKKHQETVTQITIQEQRLREYYETSKIAEIPENVIKSHYFDYRKCERIFSKAMTLIQPESWQTYKDPVIEDGEVGLYDQYLGYKFTIAVNQVYKGSRKEPHFGLNVPAALKVKNELSIHFKHTNPFSRTKSSPDHLPVLYVPEAQMKILMPLNEKISKARRQAVGTQEHIIFDFSVTNNDYHHTNNVYLFRDGTVLNLDYRVWNNWLARQSEDEAAVKLAYAANHPEKNSFSADVTYYRDKPYE